ncbi:hypothetical protein [Herbiconiux sp. YIM B11900]|uniref:hypothetical protein n=1 Tax=Herbiconiux sp. YIM B11900 TaxID=3404131 RepID=UPI003F86F230
MIRIGRHPLAAAWRLVVVVTAGGSAVLAALASAVFMALGAGAWSYLLAFLSVWAVLGGGVAIGLRIAYSVIEWDPDRRVARLRGREVPLDTITEGWRAVSSGNGAAYLAYRFVSTEGPSARVLVAGRPMRGLDEDGVAALARFVRELPLRVPGDGTQGARAEGELTDRQRAEAVSLTEGGGKSRVSAHTLLAELGEPTGLPDSASGATPDADASGHPAISAREAARLERHWEEDDAAAATVLSEQVPVARRLRRLFFWLVIAALGVAAAAIVYAVVQEELERSLDNDVVLVFVVGGFGLGVLFLLAWSAAADADVRHRRRLAETAWDGLDADERRRGLAAPYLLAFAEPVRRFRMVLAFVLCTLGLLVMLFSIFLIAEPEPGDLPVLGFGVLAAGVAMEVWAAVDYIRLSRRKRADAELLILRGGWRLVPPSVRA